MEECDGKNSREGLGIHRLENFDTSLRFHTSLRVYPCYKRVTSLVHGGTLSIASTINPGCSSPFCRRNVEGFLVWLEDHAHAETNSLYRERYRPPYEPYRSKSPVK